MYPSFRIIGPDGLQAGFFFCISLNLFFSIMASAFLDTLPTSKLWFPPVRCLLTDLFYCHTFRFGYQVSDPGLSISGRIVVLFIPASSFPLCSTWFVLLWEFLFVTFGGL